MSDSDESVEISRQRTTPSKNRPRPRQQQQQQQQPSQQSPYEYIDLEEDDDHDSEFTLPCPVTPSSSTTPLSDDVHIAPRRSTRIRNRPVPFSIRNNNNNYVDHEQINDSTNNNDDHNTTPHRLEQIDCVTPKDFGLDDNHPSSKLRVWIHPVAMALISLHAHLSRTEVIGLLGGTIIQSLKSSISSSSLSSSISPASSIGTSSNANTSTGSSSSSSPLEQQQQQQQQQQHQHQHTSNCVSSNDEINLNNGNKQDENLLTHVIIAEAFPVQGLGDRVLAKSGRNAFSEVELDPENSVEVISRIQQKNLQVIGWYHSHPDAAFTVEPSRVDIENQANYQQLLFKDSPFVGAIIAPYNEDLPDHNPQVQFFHVHENDVPLKLPFKVRCLDYIDQCITDNEERNEQKHPFKLNQSIMNVMKGYDFADSFKFPMEDFVAECFTLISSFCHFPKRVRLERNWRREVKGFEKLRNALRSIIYEMTLEEDGVESSGSVVRNREDYMEGIRLVMDEVEQRWTESGQKDDERRERNRIAAKKKKRQRRR